MLNSGYLYLSTSLTQIEFRLKKLDPNFNLSIRNDCPSPFKSWLVSRWVISRSSCTPSNHSNTDHGITLRLSSTFPAYDVFAWSLWSLLWISSYPPPREKCAGPSCMNPYKYRDSKSKLPLCSLQCYRALHAKTLPLSACWRRQQGALQAMVAAASPASYGFYILKITEKRFKLYNYLSALRPVQSFWFTA